MIIETLLSLSLNLYVAATLIVLGLFGVAFLFLQEMRGMVSLPGEKLWAILALCLVCALVGGLILLVELVS